MFCTKCGNEIKEGNKFCDNCGTTTDGSSNNLNVSNNNGQTIKKLLKFCLWAALIIGGIWLIIALGPLWIIAIILLLILLVLMNK